MANGQYANGNNEQYGAVPEAGGGSELPAGAILMWTGTIASVRLILLLLFFIIRIFEGLKMQQ